ncbi:hypothetical protein B0H63DRAFT_368597, partial [Podospora didyma]
SNSASMSPISSVSDRTIGSSSSMTRGHHHQQTALHSSYVPQTQHSNLVSSPPHYLQTQVGPQMSMYPQIPASRAYAQPSHFGYQLSSLPPQPSPLSFHSYPPVYPSYATSTYHHHSPSLAIAPYHSPSLLHLPVQKRPSIFGRLPPEILRRIGDHMGYLDLHNLCAVSRWFKAHIDPFWASEEERIAAVRHAEQYYKRYFPTSALPTSDKKQGREYDNKHPLSFGCYHCFMIKGPENFELFKWNNTMEESEQSDAGSTPKPAQTRAAPPTSSPYYDPSITRSSIAASNQASGGATSVDQSPRIKETWGVRRFCIQCGIKKRYYRPGDLIDLYKTKEAVWVCQCWKTHTRPAELKCQDCGSFIPLSAPTRRRG